MHQKHSLFWALGLFVAITVSLTVINIVRTQPEPTPVANTTPQTGLTLLAAGDIATCQNEFDEATAKILDQYPGSLILTLGDNVYDSGKISEYLNCYEPTWGRHRDRTYPSIGNHDYGTAGGDDYFSYFERSKPSYYSFNRGNWHFIALDSNCSITACAVGSEQEVWLKNDLNKITDDKCVLAYMHHPRISSGKHGNDDEVQPLWDALYQERVDIVLSGHDHTYERFSPLAPDGTVDSARGLRYFVAGTGGKDLYEFEQIKTGSVARNNTEHGVIKFELKTDSFSWKFLHVEGGTFTDSGSAKCYQA